MPSHLITKIDSWGKKLFPQFCRKGDEAHSIQVIQPKPHSSIHCKIKTET